jgi:hypothetical protein
MTPIPEWRRVLRHAWSVRFMAASVVLSSAGGALMLLNPEATGHPYLVAAAAFFLSAIGGVLGLGARFTQQKDVP